MTRIQSYFWRWPRPQFLNLEFSTQHFYEPQAWVYLRPGGTTRERSHSLCISGCLKTSFRFLVEIKLKNTKLDVSSMWGKRALYLHPWSLHRDVNWWIQHLLPKAFLWHGPEIINKVLQAMTALSRGLKKQIYSATDWKLWRVVLMIIKKAKNNAVLQSCKKIYCLSTAYI